MPVLGILLAAGHGSRFRQATDPARNQTRNKLCAPYRDQDKPGTVFEHSLRKLQAAVDEVIVVTRPQYLSVLQTSLEAGIQPLEVETEGLGESLGCALQSLGQPQYKGFRGCLVCLGDMPAIAPASYALLARQLQPAAILAPSFNGQRGHPVAFGRDWFAELSQLSGTQGPRQLLQGAHFQQLAVDDPGVLFDVDTPDDLNLRADIEHL